MDGYRPFIALLEIDWFEAVLGTDPILQDAVVHIELAHMSVAEIVAFPYPDEILLGSDRLLPQFDLPDYRIYGPVIATAKSFTYLPTDPGSGFHVGCGERNDVRHMSVCVINANYTPDDHIRLKARLYFPPDPASERAVAQIHRPSRALVIALRRDRVSPHLPSRGSAS